MFRSHLDGAHHGLTPGALDRDPGRLLGSDIVMQLDECIAWPQPTRRAASAPCGFRSRWAERCKARVRRAGAPSRAVRHPAGRRRSRTCARNRPERLVEIGFDGYAIGGLAVGEPQAVMLRDARDGGAAAAGRPAALPDGRRQADDLVEAAWRAASTCSTACCRPAPAATASPRPASARSTCATRATPRIRARSTLRAAAPPAATIRAPICITSPRRTRSSAPCCSARSISTTSRT